MKLSARNQLRGRVETIDHGMVITTLKVRLVGGDVVTASITREAAEELDLKEGKDVIAVIKSSDVMVAVD